MRVGSPPPMIGRSYELAELEAGFVDASLGESRVVVIGGEAGIGKTRLVDEFLASVEAPAVVTRGQCVEFGTVGLPYAPLTGVFRDLVREFGDDAVFEAAAGAVSTLRSLVELRTPVERDERLGVERLDEVVTTVLEQLSRDRTIVVAIEDLHWADPATLDVLRFLSRMIRDGRVLLVLTYRSDDVGRGHPLRPLLAELERNRRASRILLDRLDAAQVRAQAHGILGADPSHDDVRVLFERSEGVPFFVEELLGCGLDTVAGEVPATLRELLLGRYETLGTEAQRVVRVLAAAGGYVDHEVLAEVAGMPADELDDVLRVAVEAGVIVVTGRGYEFRHALVREAVADQLLPGESARVHHGYAVALESRTGDPARRAVRAVLVSSHWLEAHAYDEAFRAALEGMQLSRASFAHATAAQLGERALALWNDVDDPESAGMGHVELLDRVARSWRSAGESSRALATIDQALAEADPADLQTRARLLRNKGLMIDAEGRADALGLFEQALALLGDADDPTLRAGILAEAASKYMVSGQSDRAIAAATEALAIAPPPANRIRSVAANVRAGTLTHLSRIDEGAADYVRALEEAGDDRDALLRYYVNYSDTLHLLGRFAESIDVATTGIRIAAEAGVARTSGAILALNTVDPLFALGEWDRADTLISDSLELDPPAVFGIYLRRARIRSVLWRGDPERARSLFASWQRMMSELADFEDQVAAGLALDIAEVELALDDLDGAWEWAGRLVTRERLSSPPWELPIAPTAARVIARRRDAAGDPQLQADDVARLREVIKRDPWPTRSLWAAFTEAEIGGPSGSGDDPGLWRSALAIADSPEAPIVARMQLLHGLARSLVRTGDRQSAAEVLDRLQSIATTVGSGLVAGWVDHLRTDAGLAPHDPASTDREELTAREQQVLDLIAEGLSNGQIAERLYISRKTVSVHVSAILRKLRAASRTEAARLHLSRS